MTSSVLVDEHRDARVLRSATRRLIPLVTLMVLMAYVDRSNLAVLGGPMDDSLGMSATAFGFATGLFFWGYALFEIPSNVALVKYGSRAWLSRIMVSWGAITGVMFFVQNEWQFGILRFLLGVAEAGLSPGIIMFLTMWFPRSKQVKPLSLYQMAIPIGTMLGALITSGLLMLFQVPFGGDSWRWVFLAEGIFTIGLGVVIFMALPNKPTDAKWLSESDATYLTKRIAEENEAAGPDSMAGSSEWQRIKNVMKSGKAWYLAFNYLAMLIGFWAVTFFLPQIISEQFGTNAVNSGLLSSIPWAFALITILIVGRLARNTINPNRWVATLQALAALGLILAAIVAEPMLILLGLTISLCGIQAACPIFYRFQTQLFNSAIMTAVLLALVNSVGNFGGFIGPSVFGFSSDHLGGTGPALAFMAVSLIIAAIGSYFAPRVLKTKEIVTISKDLARREELPHA